MQTYCGVLIYLSVADSDSALELTVNQTTLCLGDHYYLFCISQEPFGEMCNSTTADWQRGANRIPLANSTYTVINENSTLRVLKFRITVDEFREPQTFQCTANKCKSNRVTVGKFGELYKPGTHMTYDW